MTNIIVGQRYTGTLERVSCDPLRFFVQIAPNCVVPFALADTALKTDVDTDAVLSALAPAIGGHVEIDVRRESDDEVYTADMWYPEPIIEDDEVEYVSMMHLRTVLVREGLVTL
jgi:hypothetical protein